MIRFGLCCIFKEQPIKFRRTTAKYLGTFPQEVQKQRLAELCAANAQSLADALRFCRDNRIGSFRINSQILPLKTHPSAGYELDDLPDGAKIIEAYKECGAFSRRHDIRTTFHPDQFVILSSPDPDVVTRSIADLAYQARVAEWVNADVINIHAGGVYNDKPSALARLAATIVALPGAVRRRLTLENDDRSYTPRDLLPVCRELNIPLVYDVHHHRCLPDGLSVESATEQAMETSRLYRHKRSAQRLAPPQYHRRSRSKGQRAGGEKIDGRNSSLRRTRFLGYPEDSRSLFPVARECVFRMLSLSADPLIAPLVYGKFSPMQTAGKCLACRRTQNVFFRKDPEQEKWEIVYAHYADAQEVRMGEAEYEGEFLHGLEFAITFCPYCGKKLS